MATINWPIAEQWFMKGPSSVLDNSFYFFDLGNILQSNHSEVKFWRGDWVRKKQKDMKRKSHFPTGKEEPSSRLQCSNFSPSKKKLEKYKIIELAFYCRSPNWNLVWDPSVMRVADWQIVSMGRFRTKVTVQFIDTFWQPNISRGKSLLI